MGKDKLQGLQERIDVAVLFQAEEDLFEEARALYKALDFSEVVRRARGLATNW